MTIDDPPSSAAGADRQALDAVQEMDLEALIDDELTEARRQVVLAAIDAKPELREKYIALCRQKSMLHLWWHSTSRHT